MLLSDTLSVLIPLYNEEEFIRELLRRVVAAPLPPGVGREIVIVDDCSKDQSVEIVEDFIAEHPDVRIRLIRQPKNGGKGSAIRTAIDHAEGEYSIIQDADLEYDPNEYMQMVRPLVEGKADVVFGSRFLIAGERRVLYFWHSLANQMLTLLCNLFADLNLTDMETCYKSFRTSLIKSIPIENDRFGIEPELTIKFSRRKARIFEVPISYNGRTYEEGKKIGLKDAFEALWVILRTAFAGRIYKEIGPTALDAMTLAPKFHAWMADTIRPYVGQKVLEIGAGMGSLTRCICSKRSIYYATDFDPEYLDQLKKAVGHRPSIRIRKLDVENDYDFAPLEQQVDTVLCMNVLEHIEDDAATLGRIRTLLQPGGRLVLLVPSDPEAYGTLDKHLGHYRRYTRDQVQKLLMEAGFDVEKYIDFNHVSLPGWKFRGQVTKRPVVSPFTIRMFDKFVWLWRKIDNKLPWGPTSIIAIARRKE